jgi:hypothetical protein
VKDGATAIAALGQDIDTALVDLKGGTTGQVLAKASATDLDYSWVTTDDTNAIQNAIVDAKGDLIAASAADVPARLAVGNNGEMLVADSSTATGLRWQADFAAGKNKIINGDFGIWQRGTSISLTNGNNTYGADRFAALVNFSAGTSSISQQTFTPGTAPVAGYEGSNFMRITCGSTATYAEFSQRIEDVRTFAGQTVTLSFWAKASASFSTNTIIAQNFGSGGSSEVATYGSGTITIGTSWARYSVTIAVPSIAGKTIGTSSYLRVYPLSLSATLNSATLDFWGVQVEAASTASAFQTATGTKQGELAACQRYYWRENLDTFVGGAINGFSTATTSFQLATRNPVAMRVGATAVDFSALRILDTANSAYSITNITLLSSATNKTLSSEVTATISGGTAGRWGMVQGNGTGYLGFSAEL